MKLYIRNMVCDRCRFAIRDTLETMGVRSVSVHLGEVDLGDRALDESQLREFRQAIEALGFELISDKKSRVIQKIKAHIIALLQEGPGLEKVTLSTYLSERLYQDYRNLSTLFSSVEGVTIEQYFISQRLEKVKELLVYDELTLTQIAHELGFSSVAHLSGQFRKLTGQSPSEFKRLRDGRGRKPLDKT